MESARKKKRDAELKRLKAALRENEELMQEAAINYENLVAVKEDLTAAIQAQMDSQRKKTPVN